MDERKEKRDKNKERRKREKKRERKNIIRKFEFSKKKHFSDFFDF